MSPQGKQNEKYGGDSRRKCESDHATVTVLTPPPGPSPPARRGRREVKKSG